MLKSLFTTAILNIEGLLGFLEIVLPEWGFRQSVGGLVVLLHGGSPELVPGFGGLCGVPLWPWTQT